MEFAAALRRVRDTAPLVQCITNFVTVNDCANIILAAGGSPSMADDIREAAESAAGADALVCNLGAIGKVDSMISAGQSANRAGHPVVLDPVAAGGTALRRQESTRLLEHVHFAAIRGNASEIRALALGVGMCFTMVWGRMVSGIVIGLAGIVVLLCLIPLTKGIRE